jgi:hypothetical protein
MASGVILMEQVLMKLTQDRMSRMLTVHLKNKITALLYLL